MLNRTHPALALCATLMVQMLASLVLAAPAVLAPVVAPLLGFAPDRVGLFVSLAYLAAMLSGLWSGRGVARIGAVRFSQAAMLACALGALVSVTGHPGLLLAAAVIMGGGYGMINPASTALLGRHSPVARRGLFFSVKQTGVPLGVALAGVLLPAGLLVLGWQLSLVAAGALCAALAVALLPAVARLDPGTVLNDGTSPPSRPAAHGAAALWSVLRDPPLRRLSLMSLAFACAQLAFVTFLVSLLNLQLGHPLAWAAGVLAVTQVASTIARIVLGYVADRWIDAGRLLGLIGIAMGAACVALSLLDQDTPTAGVVAVAIICAATSMGWNGVFLAELTRTASARSDLATVAGATQFFTFSGSMIGPLVFGEIVRAGGSYGLGFLLIATLPAVAGGWMLATRGRVMRRARQAPLGPD